uniref:ATP synthase subunit a n=1 Tax=Ectomomyrmex javanus TaxID=2571052 RepID=A0A4D6NYI5_9HYME|nr:ATP synthase F0 subunit 6 [Ectomomyrmex javanus]QCE31826.1 ATP synthase F0 subunit 6 [Ectomomyrmex javanus]
MMMNIFNIFDPSTSMFLSLNWLSPLIIFIFYPYQFWLIPSRFIFFWTFILNYLFNEFKLLLKFSFSNLIIFLSLFYFIVLNNFMGLFPYIFTASSHMSFCLSLSFNLWLSVMLFGWIKFTNNMFIHLTPLNTPSILMPFMVLIEFISLLIRPITLSIRLTANMIAGHLLLSLLGSSGQSIHNILFFIFFIFTQIILYILEIAVSIIQAYVFSILSLLYSSEI